MYSKSCLRFRFCQELPLRRGLRAASDERALLLASSVGSEQRLVSSTRRCQVHERQRLARDVVRIPRYVSRWV